MSVIFTSTIKMADDETWYIELKDMVEGDFDEEKLVDLMKKNGEWSDEEEAEGNQED